MVRFLTPQLKEWDKDKSVHAVIMKGSGDKAFCAGGDIVDIYKSKKDPLSKSTLYKDFFREEYILNHLIGTLSKPYIALIDGITMGGGVGLSVHGKVRVATEKTLFAMPETAIGFFCDVGGTYFLPRLPGELGMYLALTGFRLKGYETKKAGVATHYISSSKINNLVEDLSQLKNSSLEEINKSIENYSEKVNIESEIDTNLKNIDRVFGEESVEKIIEKTFTRKFKMVKQYSETLKWNVSNQFEGSTSTN